ncbi:MAG: hypothetical protein DRJ10_19830, partial [Bacteroidetes bacterium]
MKRLIIYILSLFIVIAACKKDDNLEDKNGNVYGVLETEIGDVIPNSTVTLSQNNEVVRQTVTDSEGKFTFEDVAEGTYQISAFHSFYKNSKVYDYEIKGNTNHELTFVFYPFVSVSGLAINAFGVPLQGVLVSLYQEG